MLQRTRRRCLGVGVGCVYYGVLRHVEVAAKFLSAVKSWVRAAIVNMHSITGLFVYS